MKLILIGASGHGKVCAEIAEFNDYEDILFLDNDRGIKECGGHTVVGEENVFEKFVDESTDFFVSIGNGETRRRIQDRIANAGGKIATLIHPKSVVSKDTVIGAGVAVMAGVVINPGTVIGEGCIVNTSSSIDHDCRIGAYSHVAVGSHICGTVDIGDNCWIGAGSTVLNNVNICNGCVIGAGALVIRDLATPATYIGMPVKQRFGGGIT